MSVPIDITDDTLASSLVPVQCASLAPPALFKKGEEGRKKKDVLHLSRCYTHTHRPLCHTQLSHNFVAHLFHTYNLLHTNLSRTTLSHTTLLHTQTHTHNTVTHTHSSFTQPGWLAPSPFLPAFPISFSHLLGGHWKKLTCGVIRSVNYLIFFLLLFSSLL